MHNRVDRAALLRRGGALLVSGAALGIAAPVAGATPPDEDLAYLRLLVGVELLAVDVHTRALAAGTLAPPATRVVEQMLSDEKAHLAGLSSLLAGAGQIAATADDIDFSYPKSSFATSASATRLAARVEALALGAYLGAVENVGTPALRLPLGQIAANEAQHAGALAALAGRGVIGRAFAPSLSIDDVSSRLDQFES